MPANKQYHTESKQEFTHRKGLKGVRRQQANAAAAEIAEKEHPQTASPFSKAVSGVTMAVKGKK